MGSVIDRFWAENGVTDGRSDLARAPTPLIAMHIGRHFIQTIAMLCPIFGCQYFRTDILQLCEDLGIVFIDATSFFLSNLFIQIACSILWKSHRLATFIEPFLLWTFSLQNKWNNGRTTYSKDLVDTAKQMLVSVDQCLLLSGLGQTTFEFHSLRLEVLYSLIVYRASHVLKAVVQILVPLVVPKRRVSSWAIRNRNSMTYMILTTMFLGFSDTASRRILKDVPGVSLY